MGFENGIDIESQTHCSTGVGESRRRVDDTTSLCIILIVDFRLWGFEFGVQFAACNATIVIVLVVDNVL